MKQQNILKLAQKSVGLGLVFGIASVLSYVLGYVGASDQAVVRALKEAAHMVEITRQPSVESPHKSSMLPMFPTLQLDQVFFGKPAPGLIGTSHQMVPIVSYTAPLTSTREQVLAAIKNSLTNHQGITRAELPGPESYLVFDRRDGDAKVQLRNATLIVLYQLPTSALQLLIVEARMLPLGIKPQIRPVSLEGLACMEQSQMTVIVAGTALETRHLLSDEPLEKLKSHLRRSAQILEVVHETQQSNSYHMIARTAHGGMSIDILADESRSELVISEQMPMDASSFFKSHQAHILTSLESKGSL